MVQQERGRGRRAAAGPERARKCRLPGLDPTRSTALQAPLGSAAPRAEPGRATNTAAPGGDRSLAAGPAPSRTASRARPRLR